MGAFQKVTILQSVSFHGYTRCAWPSARVATGPGQDEGTSAAPRKMTRHGVRPGIGYCSSWEFLELEAARMP